MTRRTASHDAAMLAIADPPWNEEAEQSVLGGLILDNTAMPLTAGLVPADFFASQHALIFAAIRHLIASGSGADVITVAARLQALDQADDCGGVVYLNAIAASVPSAANMRSYVEVVRERSQRRRQIAAADKLREDAYNTKLPLDNARSVALINSTAPALRAAPAPADAIARLLGMAVTQEHVDIMADTRMIWRSLIASSHLAVWSAPGNGGKTTLAKEAAADLARAGFTVLFFQEDAAAGDLPALFEHAQAHGYVLLNSTLNGRAPSDQLDTLYDLAAGDADLSNLAAFFDTLKKYCDLMSKGGTREFFQLMRSLTTRGMTIVLLGHTNKHVGLDGKLIFEGVGDVRNDVDELLYIESIEDKATGSVLMTIRPDKVRSAIVEATFRLDKHTMAVMALDAVIDVGAIERRQADLREDADLIAVVRGVLKAGGMPLTALVEKVMESGGVGRRLAKRIVDRYLGTDPADKHAFWIETYIRVGNTRYISLPPP